VISQRGQQPVEAVFPQGLRETHATHLLNATLETTVLADTKKCMQITDIDEFLRVENKILSDHHHNLHKALANNGRQRKSSSQAWLVRHAYLLNRRGDVSWSHADKRQLGVSTGPKKAARLKASWLHAFIRDQST
jgi:hypothetical protein